MLILCSGCWMQVHVHFVASGSSDGREETRGDQSIAVVGLVIDCVGVCQQMLLGIQKQGAPTLFDLVWLS